MMPASKHGNPQLGIVIHLFDVGSHGCSRRGHQIAMSQSVILISPSQVQMAELSGILKERWRTHHWYTPQSSPTLQIQEVSEGVSYLSIDELDSIAAIAEYQENDDLPLQIRSRLDGKRCFMLTFNDERLFMKAGLLMLERLTAQQDEMWLDNGYGALIPARTFAEAATRDPGWQWRQYQHGSGCSDDE